MKTADNLLRLLYPCRCRFCGELIADGDRCPACAASEISLRLQGEDRITATRRRKTRGIEPICASYRYDGAVAELVNRFKFAKRYEQAKFISRVMAEDFAAFQNGADYDFVVSVPSFLKRSPHGSLLARAFSENIGVPYFSDAILKIKHTEKQHRLGEKERSKNLENAFACNQLYQIDNCRVLIVDDVLTSGNTLSECAKALLRAGVFEISAAVFCCTDLKRT